MNPAGGAGIPVSVRQELERLLGDGADFSAAAAHAYSVDNSKLRRVPGGVLFPRTAEETRRIVEVACRERIPVVPRGRGTSTTGASLAERGGLVLSTERLASEIRIDVAERIATVAPGVLNGELQAAAAREGLFWPPDPSSAAYCSVGGNLATAAAGPRHIRHGGARGSVRRLKVVTGSGELVTFGSKVGKSAVGYDLAGLMVGSEGTLGVIVEAELALAPLAKEEAGVVAEFGSNRDCAQALGRILAMTEPPSAAEFLDAGALGLVRSRYGGIVADDARALLLVVAEGPESEVHARRIADACGAGARVESDMDALWAARKALSPALRDVLPGKINEDVCLPPSRLAEFLDRLGTITREEGVRNINFGHAADGNLHVNFLFDPQAEGDRARAARAVDRMFGLVAQMDGSISGEHGIGIAKRTYIGRELPPEAIAIMKGIKQVFDPCGIMNPGKIFPE